MKLSDLLSECQRGLLVRLYNRVLSRFVNLADTTVGLTLGDSNANVAFFAPVGIPRVPDDRVHLTVLFAETDGDHTVVNGCCTLEGRVDDAALVRVEGTPHCEGSRHRALSQLSHERIVIGGWQVCVRVPIVSVENGVALILGASLLGVLVGVIFLVSRTISSPETVRVSGPATLATTIVNGVAIDELLLRKVVQLAHLDCS